MSDRVCVVGFGRLGETLAHILKDTFSVVICEANKERSAYAREQAFKIVAQQDLNNYQTIFICVPISQFETTVSELAPHITPGSLVMDVCSVKVFPVQVMKRLLPDSVSIIATHPLFGPDSVRKGLHKLTTVTYPIRASGELYNQWDAFWKGLGLHVVKASPEEHDKTIAYTLGMTHFFGRIMGELKLEPQAITTFGYEALYEVMCQTNRDSWQLFHDMQHYNPFAKEMRDRVYQAIQTVEAKLDAAVQ